MSATEFAVKIVVALTSACASGPFDCDSSSKQPASPAACTGADEPSFSSGLTSSFFEVDTSTSQVEALFDVSL
jgi:hypothetical protein